MAVRYRAPPISTTYSSNRPKTYCFKVSLLWSDLYIINLELFNRTHLFMALQTTTKTVENSVYVFADLQLGQVPKLTDQHTVCQSHGRSNTILLRLGCFDPAPADVWTNMQGHLADWTPCSRRLLLHKYLIERVACLSPPLQALKGCRLHRNDTAPPLQVLWIVSQSQKRTTGEPAYQPSSSLVYAV